MTTAFGKTVFIGDEGGLQTLRLGGSALTSGYTWGRAGPGPREVARAILIDATGNEMLAERLCRPFTWEVVSKLPADEFCVTRADVLAWVEGRGAPSPPQNRFGLELTAVCARICAPTALRRFRALHARSARLPAYRRISVSVQPR